MRDPTTLNIVTFYVLLSSAFGSQLEIWSIFSSILCLLFYPKRVFEQFSKMHGGLGDRVFYLCWIHSKIIFQKKATKSASPGSGRQRSAIYQRPFQHNVAWDKNPQPSGYHDHKLWTVWGFLGTPPNSGAFLVHPPNFVKCSLFLGSESAMREVELTPGSH